MIAATRAPLALITGLLSLSVCGSELPVAGGLQALPDRQQAAVELVNAGFESGLEGWRENPCFSVTDESAGRGNKVLRFDAAVPFKYVPSTTQQLPELESGLYALTFRARSVGLPDVDKAKAAGYLRVGILGRTRDGARYAQNADPIHGTSAWKERTLKFHVPETIEPGSLLLTIHRYRSVSQGIAYVDDIRLSRLLPPDVEAYLRYPNYRGYLPEDGPMTVKLWVKINALRSRLSARVTVDSQSTGKQVVVRALPPDTTETLVELDARGWPTGVYIVRVSLGDYAYPAYHISKITVDERAAMGMWFDERSILQVEGKPMFPIGFYNTVMQFGVVDDSELARLDMLKEAPVNASINYTWWGCDLATRRRYLGEMHKRGILYFDTMMPFSPPRPGDLSPERFPIIAELAPAAGVLDTQDELDAFVFALASRMRTYPGHAGWYVMDERPFDRIPDIFHQCVTLRKADPDHPTLGVSNRSGELPLWRDVFDVHAMDPYPFINMKLDRPLTLVAEETRATVEATQASRPVWTVLQFFQGWSTDRWPTQEELRTMSLMAVVEGARGVFFWSFGRRALAEAPADRRDAYWARALAVTRELKQLEPALLAPDAPQEVASVSDPRVRWLARAARDKLYVFAYRPARKLSEREGSEPLDIRFTLEDGRAATMTLRPDEADWIVVERVK